MRLFPSLFLILSVILVISCACGQSPELNITGKWHDALDSGFFGWGEGYLQQEGNKVSGTIGNYTVKGVVSGTIVDLVFLWHGGEIHYTARLEMSKDLLTGKYFKASDKEQTSGSPLSFARTK